MAIETQLEAMTDYYFQHGGKMVQDLYTETSFVLDYFLKQKKGNYDTHEGGRKIKIPLRYDGNKAGFFTRGETLDSTKTEAITAVYLPWRYA